MNDEKNNDNECRGCEYYDAEEDRCTAFSCDPWHCDDPLPCEE